MADPLPISLVAHTVFCSRRAWLEAAGETTPSFAIEHGVAAHGAVDARLQLALAAGLQAVTEED